MSSATPVYCFVCRSCRQVYSTWAPRCSNCLSTKGLNVSIEGGAPLESSKPPQDRGPAVQAMEPADLLKFPVERTRPRLVIARSPSHAHEPDRMGPEEAPEEAFDDGMPSSEGPVPITEIAETSFVRDSTGLAPLDHVLGGGLVVASVVLLASPPGIGKSSLTLQMLVGLRHQCLYTTGEETCTQLAGTARRIGALSPRLHVLAERRLDKIFAHARMLGARTIAIDSIQKMICTDVNGRAGSMAQLKECTARLVDYAKKNDTTLWLIGHVTGDNTIAGPKTIEHDVDVVLELTQGSKLEGRERILRCPDKNRFGSTSVAGHFELTGKGFVPLDLDGWDEERL